MRYSLFPLCTLLAITLVASACSAETTDARTIVYSTDKYSANGNSLAKILRQSVPGDITVVDSLEEAVRQHPNVLAIYAVERDSIPRLAPTTLQALKKMKVVGFGYEAAELFSLLGLEISQGNLRSARDELSRELVIQESTLTGTHAGQQIAAYRTNSATIHYNARACQGVRLHPLGKRSAFVEAVARWPHNSNYAPIAREGNHLFVGLAEPLRMWSDEYAEFIGLLVRNFSAQANTPFVTAQRETTPAGEYKFELAEKGSTEKLDGRVFYFRFEKPTRLSMRFEYDGAKEMEFEFAGQGSDCHEWEFTTNGENVVYDTYVSEDDLCRVGSNYWWLRVLNIDENTNAANCNLSIQYGGELTGQNSYTSALPQLSRKLFDLIALDDIRSAPVTDSPVEAMRDGDKFLGEGSIILLHTSDGNYAKAMVEKYTDSLTLSWTTYGGDGSIISSGSHLRIAGSCTADLDTGRPSTRPYHLPTGAADIWWHRVSKEEGYLSPRQDVKLSAYLVHPPPLAKRSEEEQDWRARWPKLGKPFPELVVTTLDGKTLSTTNLLDKVVLIDFWATGCGPCRKEIPGLVSLYDNTHTNGFEIVGISLDRDRAKLETYMEENRIRWIQCFDGNEDAWINEITERLGLYFVPFSFLIDRDGVLRERNSRGRKLADAVYSLLEE